MTLEFMEEQWYRNQTDRWAVLKSRGWICGKPEVYSNKVALVMYKGLYNTTVYISKNLSPRLIHTLILEHCERFANEIDAKSTLSLPDKTDVSSPDA